MTLRAIAEQAARERHGPDHVDPAYDCRECISITEAIQRVAREFAGKACAQLSYLRDLGDTGRPAPVEWHLKTYEQEIAAAIAEAEKG